MKRKRHSTEQIIGKLRQAEAEVGNGVAVSEVCRKLEISEATYHRWRNQYGGLKDLEIKRLRELEKQNAQLKKLVAEQALEVSIIKEVLKGKY